MYSIADRASTVTTLSGSTLFLLHNWPQKIRNKNMPGQIYPLLKNEIIFLMLSQGSTLFVSNCPFYSLPGSPSRVMVFDLFQISSLCRGKSNLSSIQEPLSALVTSFPPCGAQLSVLSQASRDYVLFSPFARLFGFL